MDEGRKENAKEISLVAAMLRCDDQDNKVTSMKQSSVRRLMMIPVFAALLLLSYWSLGLDRLEGRILDDKTGQSVAATLVLTDGEGKPLEIEGKHSHVEYLGKRRCYVDGNFVLNSRPSRLVSELRRGLDTLRRKGEIDMSQRGSEAPTFRLRRCVDLRALAYLRGDTDVSPLTP